MSAELKENQKPVSSTLLKKATRKDKSIVIDILCESFKNDPHINWMLKRSHHPEKLKILMNFIFEKTIRIGDIYLTQDDNAVALWKSNIKEDFTLEYIFRNIALLLNLGLMSIINILQNERFTHQQYPKGKRFLHLYLIGVLPSYQGKGYSSKLLKPVLDKMDSDAIPVYLETANANNVKIYEKKGFKLYNTWFKSGLHLYYMRK